MHFEYTNPNNLNSSIKHHDIIRYQSKKVNSLNDIIDTDKPENKLKNFDDIPIRGFLEFLPSF